MYYMVYEKNKLRSIEDYGREQKINKFNSLEQSPGKFFEKASDKVHGAT